MTKTVVNGKVQFLQHELESEKIVELVLKKLNYPNSFIEFVKSLVGNHMKLKYGEDSAKLISDKNLFNFKQDHSDYLDDLLDLIHADNISHGTEFDMKNQIPIVKQRLKDLKYTPRQEKKDLPVNGNDIISYFNVTGKTVGDYLKRFEEIYADNPDLTKEEYLKMLELKEHLYIKRFSEFINL